MHSRIPKKPITSSVSSKPGVSKNSKAKLPLSSINGKNIESSLKVPAIHHVSEKKKQVNTNKGVENTGEKSSNESLKQQIDHISNFSYRQSELINYFQAELARLENLTEFFSNESNLAENHDQFSSIKKKFKFLIDNYIKQSEATNNPTGKANEGSTKQRSIDFDDDFQENQESKSRAAQNEILDRNLGEKIRYLFDGQNDNDSIVHKVKIIKEFVEQMIDNDGIDEAIVNLKTKIIEIETIKKKYGQITSEKEEIEKQLKKTEQQLQDTQTQFTDGKNILAKVKSIYLNRQITSDFCIHIENDIDLSTKVRSIFNEVENNDVIVRTIESNIETAKDNGRVSDLVTKLEELNFNASELNKKYEREQKEKNFPSEEKQKEIEDLNCQLNDQKNTIQNLLDVIVNIKRSFDVRIEIMEEEKKFIKFRESDEKAKEIAEIKKSYEKQMKDIQFKLSSQERKINELTNKASKQQQLKEQKEKENSELRALIEKGKNAKNQEIERIKGELNSQKKASLELNRELQGKQKEISQLKEEITGLLGTIEELEIKNIGKTKEEKSSNENSKEFLYESTTVSTEERIEPEPEAKQLE